jgi:hypothetical protein
MKRVICVILCSSLFLCALFAKEIYKKPSTNDVVIVTRISVTPPVNDEFYFQYAILKGRTMPQQPKVPKGGERSVVTLNPTHGGLFSYGFSYLHEKAFLPVLSSIPRTRVVKFKYAKLLPGGPANGLLEVKLPFDIEVTIPEGAKYIYIGSFTYHISGIHFAVVSVDKSDEFEQAQEFVRKTYGKDAVLMRVPITATN